jgi:hypothetical protein
LKSIEVGLHIDLGKYTGIVVLVSLVSLKVLVSEMFFM